MRVNVQLNRATPLKIDVLVTATKNLDITGLGVAKVELIPQTNGGVNFGVRDYYTCVKNSNHIHTDESNIFSLL